ncbi:MAG: hypothetical protein H0U81_10015 [Pyrinomonadaceae bacterium]|nr:hypothetical protein [Pyrinomonadaceae bacterium]
MAIPENDMMHQVATLKLHADGSGGDHPFASIETIENLTLTLLREVESLKGLQSFHRHKSSISLYDEVRGFETEIIEWALFRTGGNQRRAARLLNIKVTTLNAKIKRYGIEPNAALSNLINLYESKQAAAGK